MDIIGQEFGFGKACRYGAKFFGEVENLCAVGGATLVVFGIHSLVR